MPQDCSSNGESTFIDLGTLLFTRGPTFMNSGSLYRVPAEEIRFILFLGLLVFRKNKKANLGPAMENDWLSSLCLRAPGLDIF